jgi:hypothetical protein
VFIAVKHLVAEAVRRIRQVIYAVRNFVENFRFEAQNHFPQLKANIAAYFVEHVTRALKCERLELTLSGLCRCSFFTVCK